MSGKRGGRPPGPERIALLAAAHDLHAGGKSGTWHDLAALAQVGKRAARLTCWSMVKAGELEVAGSEAPMPGKRGRPRVLLRPALHDSKPGAGVELGLVLACWSATTD